jgi:hypothetical protein
MLHTWSLLITATSGRAASERISCSSSVVTLIVLTIQNGITSALAAFARRSRMGFWVRSAISFKEEVTACPANAPLENRYCMAHIGLGSHNDKK